MKYLSMLFLFISISANAVVPIYVSGEKFQYNESDFDPIIERGHVIGYEANIPVHVDLEDPFFGYPELVFDMKSEVKGSIGAAPMFAEMSAVCSGDTSSVDIGRDADIIIKRAGVVRNARFSIYNRLRTNGVCKNLNVKIEKIHSSVTDTEAYVDNFNFDLIVYFGY
ncbi:hypothetical protein J8L98_19900 [Pseudoalteromonas sp. MMG013]|uniref:hypothetical protein n=1 Tax=Pseudoalteromonas sp. MMG013 TaxID=2822687 RepID=UPI001B36FB0D|nr:hypothetical protein [Pseudoalteromonas sp. MMG013]MBQ4863955.1 hypothetical protein [Pseudoalteromonas sp. MMG013]